MCGAQRNRRVLVLREVVIRQHDDARLQLRRRQCAHHAEPGALLQVQVQDDHIHRIALDGSQRTRFGVRGSDQFDFRNLSDGLDQPFRQHFRILDE
jgi:hypothetical protein